jgi:hypothetical protein
MTPEKHFNYCKDRIEMYLEMMKRCYDCKKEK